MSTKELRGRGFAVGKVEQRLPRCFITKDLFNVFDLVAMRPDYGIVGVQVTSGSNAADRRAKILAEPQAETWLASGGRILLHGWAKRGPRGKRKTYSCNEEELTLADFDRMEPCAAES